MRNTSTLLVTRLPETRLVAGLPPRSVKCHASPNGFAVGDTIRAQATIMGDADCFALLGAVLLAAAARVALLKKGAASGAATH